MKRKGFESQMKTDIVLLITVTSHLRVGAVLNK